MHCSIMVDQVAKYYYSPSVSKQTRTSPLSNYRSISVIFEILVDNWKKRWKLLWDNFWTELKKVPVGKSGDPGLQVDQNLSKWPYFRIMFFLRDSMMGRVLSSNLLRSSDLCEARKETCSPSPSTPFIQFTSSHSDCQNQELRIGEKVVETESCTSFQVTSHEKPKRKRKRNLEIENERIEKEKLEVEKQKIQLLTDDNKRREREDNDADRQYLLSLLPLLSKVLEHKKLKLKNRLQEIFQEFIFEDGENRVEFCPTHGDITPTLYRPWLPQ